MVCMIVQQVSFSTQDGGVIVRDRAGIVAFIKRDRYDTLEFPKIIRNHPRRTLFSISSILLRFGIVVEPHDESYSTNGDDDNHGMDDVTIQ